MDRKVKNEDILLLFCEKNSDGTKHLRLKGKELQQRFGGRLEARHMKQIAYFMVNHQEIISVDLCYNNFGDQGLKDFASIYFDVENQLLYLNLMHCDITDVGMEYLSSCKYLHLKKCRLNGNKIGPLGARYIARLIEQCPSLLYIDIAETDQTLESIESILIVVEQSTLTGLNISRIVPNSYYTKYNRTILADDLSVVFRLNQCLTELIIEKMGFDGHEVDILLNGSMMNTSLQLINFSCNKIGNFGAESLAKWLKTCPNVRALDISANDIGSHGARALSYGLPFSKIRYLNLSHNKIEDWGITDILDSIKKYTQMRILFLWGNTLGSTSCQRMQRMLESGVLVQDYIDIKLYEVDGKLYAAEYPSNHLRQKFYCVMGPEGLNDIKIIRNKIYPEKSLPRQLLCFEHMGRYPPVDESLGVMKPRCKQVDEE